jgi:hypothetical protein
VETECAGDPNEHEGGWKETTGTADDHDIPRSKRSATSAPVAVLIVRGHAADCPCVPGDTPTLDGSSAGRHAFGMSSRARALTWMLGSLLVAGLALPLALLQLGASWALAALCVGLAAGAVAGSVAWVRNRPGRSR